MYHRFMPVITLRYNYLGRLQPALVAQLDARLTGNQEVMGSTPARFGSILLWRLITKYFLWSFPSADSRRVVVISGERMCTNTC